MGLVNVHLYVHFQLFIESIYNALLILIFNINFISTIYYLIMPNIALTNLNQIIADSEMKE